MKKSDLKELIKPLVKECIHEVLIEEGLLSNVVSEVAKGMQGGIVVESARPPRENTPTLQEQRSSSNEKAQASRKRLMDAIGADAYNGVNLFEGTEPMQQRAEPRAGAVDLGSPSDAGVDISSLIGGASRMWDAMK